MNRYVLGLGSSHVNASGYITQALDLIKKNKNFLLVSVSRVYENYSIGFIHNCKCLNLVACVFSQMHPVMMYREIFAIEKKLGKLGPYKNAPRNIDIDMIFSLDNQCTNNIVCLPHKELLNRDFYITPAYEALYLAKWPIMSKINKSTLKNSLRLKAIGSIQLLA